MFGKDKIGMNSEGDPLNPRTSPGDALTKRPGEGSPKAPVLKKISWPPKSRPGETARETGVSATAATLPGGSKSEHAPAAGLPAGPRDPSPGPGTPTLVPPLHPLVAPHHAWLRERGELWVGSGTVPLADGTLSFHSNFGPPGQDKPANQDYAVVWKGKRGGVPAVALAIGDGLTSSYHSELGAQAACSAALRRLVAEINPRAPRPALDAAVAAAVQATKELAGDLAANAEKSCPPGQFLSTWKYILRQGRLLQTTLTLAWLEDDRLCVGVVGDGGCLVRAANLGELRIVALPDLATQEVNALGPGDAGPIPLDHFFDQRLERPYQAVFYTDGVGRGAGGAPAKLLEALDAPALVAGANPARAFIADAIQRDPRGFDDNLTLAILRAAARRPS